MTATPMLGGAPSNHEIPSWVKVLAPSSDVEAVWLNEAGGVTYRFGDAAFLKWKPHGGPDFAGERSRLDWVARFVTAPRVLDSGSHDSGPWLLTEAIPGRSAVDQYWTARPEQAAHAIGKGLRRLHDTLPVDDCPFDWTVPARLVKAGIEETFAIETLGPMPDVDVLVVCHGDACAPNTLLDDAGECCGHVDFASLGVADRWADIAIATYSLEWNYSAGLEDILLDAYGIAPDTERTRYYRALWDLT